MSDINQLIALAGQNTPDPAKAFMESYYHAQDRKLAMQDRDKAAQKEQIAQARQNRLAELAGGDRANLSDTLMQNGYFDEAKQVGDVDKTKAETFEKQHAVAQHQWEIVGQIVSGYAGSPNVQKPQVLSGIEGLHKSGIIDDKIYQQKMEEVSQLPDDPAAINQWANTTLMQMNKTKDQLAQMHPDANARLQAQTAANGQAITQENNLMGRDIDLAKMEQGQGQFEQNMDFNRLKEDNSQGYKSAQLGLEREKALNSGGTKGSSSLQKQNDANDVLEILKQAEPLLDNSTGSGAGAAYDSAAGFLGYSTKGAKAGAGLKALEGSLISKMPKMSGPQSDKDVLLYKQMAGQIGDTSLPIETRKAAIEQIKIINQRYAGQGGASDSWQKPSNWEQFMMQRNKAKQ